MFGPYFSLFIGNSPYSLGRESVLSVLGVACLFNRLQWPLGSGGSSKFFLPAAAGAFLLLAGFIVLPIHLATNNYN